MPIISGSSEEIIKLSSQKLLNGELVSIPTETVYGLAAIISRKDAVEKIYNTKNRPSNHPLIMHISHINDVYKYAINIPKYVEVLIKHFWPGPLTLILKKSEHTPSYITGNQDTVAIRMPAHKLTLKLIQALGIPIVAPSANKFMGISPTSPAHVISEFNNTIDVIDGGSCSYGIESTIIDATRMGSFQILRPGAISRKEIYAKLGSQLINNTLKEDLRFPGNYKKHYSPRKKLISFKTIDDLSLILDQHDKVYVITYSLAHNSKAICTLNIGSLPKKFAQDFYHVLRVADDDKKTSIIAIEEPPKGDDWESIWDRLNKAKG